MRSSPLFYAFAADYTLPSAPPHEASLRYDHRVILSDQRPKTNEYRSGVFLAWSAEFIVVSSAIGLFCSCVHGDKGTTA